MNSTFPAVLLLQPARSVLDDKVITSQRDAFTPADWQRKSNGISFPAQRASASLSAFSSASVYPIRSILLNTNQRGFSRGHGTYFSSSPIILRAFSTGSLNVDIGSISMRCNGTRQRSRCFRKRIPGPHFPPRLRSAGCRPPQNTFSLSIRTTL